MTDIAVRNRAVEEEWLLRAEHFAHGAGGFAAAVTQRLETGGREYGETWTGLPIGRLFAEAREEAADQGGWGSLGLHRLLALDLREPLVRQAITTATALFNGAALGYAAAGRLHALAAQLDTQGARS